MQTRRLKLLIVTMALHVSRVAVLLSKRRFCVVAVAYLEARAKPAETRMLRKSITLQVLDAFGDTHTQAMGLRTLNWHQQRGFWGHGVLSF